MLKKPRKGTNIFNTKTQRHKKMVKKYFLIIFLKIFLRFLTEGDFLYYSLNRFYGSLYGN